MKNTNTKYWIVIALLILIIIIGAYKFIIQGSVGHHLEKLTVIHLEDGEKDFILSEMTNFLIGVQNIIIAISVNNMPLAAEYARKNGKILQKTVPLKLLGKLPIGFKELGFDTRSKFDKLALEARSSNDKKYILKQLSILMQNCITCHANYHIEVHKIK